MAHAEKCPVCGGTGKVKDNNYGSKTDGNDVECHGCSGKGWVEVADHYDTQVVRYYYTPPNYYYDEYGLLHIIPGYYDEYGFWHQTR
jgi:hypothetical protein